MRAFIVIIAGLALTGCGDNSALKRRLSEEQARNVLLRKQVAQIRDQAGDIAQATAELSAQIDKAGAPGDVKDAAQDVEDAAAGLTDAIDAAQ